MNTEKIYSAYTTVISSIFSKNCMSSIKIPTISNNQVEGVITAIDNVTTSEILKISEV